jgi:gluconokinase
MQYVIGLDLGTTNCKAIAFTENGAILASASASYNLYSPHPGWAEQNPIEVWRGVQKSTQDLNVKKLPGTLSGICISGAMHSVIPIDQNNHPLANGMTWADQRANKQTDFLRKTVDPSSIYHKTGCPLQTIYHPSKILWWVDEKPDISRHTNKFVSFKDFILFQLTGKWYIDRGLASTTGFLNIQNGNWETNILELAKIDESRLPNLTWPKEIIGEITKDAAQATSIPQGTIVIAGTHDGGLANIGAGALSFNDTVITVGTSGAVRCFVEHPILDMKERTWCYITQQNQWLAGGAINNGGLTLQWVRERFYNSDSENSFSQLEAEAAEILPGAEGLIFLPYLTGERSPHWNSSARASIHGLGLRHHRAHIARAALEGVAFCLADVYQALVSAKTHYGTGLPEKENIRLTGGITKSPLWVQILTDLLGTKIISEDIADASALGAAIIGHMALGSTTTSNFSSDTESQSIYSPNLEKHSIYRDLHKEFQNRYRQLN